jgi:cardiolipin synthase
MFQHIPNLLTLSRLFIIPIFLIIPYYNSTLARSVILGLFTYACVSDFLDGYLARKYNIGSNFGRIFDPIADKALILVVSCMILVRDKEFIDFLLYPIVIILIRELVVSGLRENLSSMSLSLKVTTLAKYKTLIQMLAFGFLIYGGTDNTWFLSNKIIGIFLLYIAMIISLITGFQYLMFTYKNMNNNN